MWWVWNLQSKNNITVDFSSAAIFYWPFSSVIDRKRNRSFKLIQNKVGYRSCFATGVKLEQFSWNSFDVKYILELIYCRPDCALSPTCFFFLTLSGISCVTILKYTLILSPQFTKKYRKQNKLPKKKISTSDYLRN